MPEGDLLSRLDSPAPLDGEVLPPLSRARREWAEKISASWRATLDSVIETGRHLVAAKEDLEHGEFEAMIERDLPFGPRTARMLMTVSRDQRLSDRNHGSVLPPSWRTLYELTKLDDSTFAARIADGSIRPDLERREVAVWTYTASRQRRHEIIAANALADEVDGDLGPFPVIYADPPWKFEIYSAKGLDRTPDQHYPTLSDEEIAAFAIGGRAVPEIAGRDAALLLWCTSSNLKRALVIMERWGFEFKTSAVWVKDKSGLGLVFRVKHELLLYGTRGNMPGPRYQPPSVFAYPRGRHSAKPPEIRTEIERMYPDFDERTRLELFARSTAKGWTCRGFEAPR